MQQIYLYLDWILLIGISLASCQQLFSKRFNLYGISTILGLATYIALHSYDEKMNLSVLIMFVSGLALIALEMFIPGGIVGTIGVITLVSAIIYVNQSAYNVAFILVISLISAIILYILNRKVLKREPVFLSRLVLADSIKSEDGYVASESRLDLIGKELVAYTDLRPAGVAVSSEEKFDVVTDGDFVEKGSVVEVTQVEGMRIVVRKK